jgi:hypothetical protein
MSLRCLAHADSALRYVWHQNIGVLPIHFAASGLSTPTSILELRGHENAAPNAMGIAACASETLIGAAIEFDKRRVTTPLRKGRCHPADDAGNRCRSRP